MTILERKDGYTTYIGDDGETVVLHDSEIALPKLIPTTDNRFIVAEDYMFQGVKVPQGYKTNGADIPRVLWSVVPPFKPKYLPAIIVHDYLCDQDRYRLADILFERLLLRIEDSFVTRAMIAIVKTYHKMIVKKYEERL